MTDQEATEATERATLRRPVSVDVRLGDKEGLDRERRYLRPVGDYDSSGVHLAVYEWLPAFEAWATGPGLCGTSTLQGPLAEGTAVTCVRCEEWRPKYERMLAPGYDPAEDDPEALREKLARIRKEVALLCDCCGDNRERVGRIRRELGLGTDGYVREDGEDG